MALRQTEGKMTLKSVHEAKDIFSSKASELVRQHAFAGIAMIWVIRTGEEGNLWLKWEDALILPLLLFALTLMADFLQYALAADRWNDFFRQQEKAGALPSTPLAAPTSINRPGDFCYRLKRVLLVLGYSALCLLLISPFLQTIWPSIAKTL